MIDCVFRVKRDQQLLTVVDVAFLLYNTQAAVPKIMDEFIAQKARQGGRESGETRAC